MTFPDFQTLCRNRRSIRYFDPQTLTKDEILELLETGRSAPNVQNLQPWTFHVIQDPTVRHAMTKASCYGNFVEGGGTLVVVTCNTDLTSPAQDPLWNPRELEYSCMAAMTQILLAATAKGLGGGWVSLHHGAVFETLGLSRNELVVGGLLLGHLRTGEEEASAEHDRKALKDIVQFH